MKLDVRAFALACATLGRWWMIVFDASEEIKDVAMAYAKYRSAPVLDCAKTATEVGKSSAEGHCKRPSNSILARPFRLEI